MSKKIKPKKPKTKVTTLDGKPDNPPTTPPGGGKGG